MLLHLFLSFFKIGLFAFGGGYVIVGLAERELVHKNKWLTKQELFDFLTLSQTLPGLISVNLALFFGNKIKGFWGGICAVAGMVFPAFIAIILLASFISKAEQFPIINHAMTGIKIAVCVLILNVAFGQIKQSIKSKKTACIGIITFLWILFQLPTAIPLLSGCVFGWVYYNKVKEVLK